MPWGARCLWGAFPLFHWITDCFQFMVGKRKVTVIFKVGRVGLELKVEHSRGLFPLLAPLNTKPPSAYCPATLACFLLPVMPIGVYLGSGVYPLCNCLIEK